MVLDGVEWGSALHVKALSLVSEEERARIVDSRSPSFDHLRLVCAPLTANRERLALSTRTTRRLPRVTPVYRACASCRRPPTVWSAFRATT